MCLERQIAEMEKLIGPQKRMRPTDTDLQYAKILSDSAGAIIFNVQHRRGCLDAEIEEAENALIPYEEPFEQ